MKRIWRFLWGRRAQGGPVSSGSSGGNELRPEGRDELCREATTSDLSPVQPLVKQCDSKCQDRDDRHSPGAWPVDPWEQESNGESAPGQAKEVSASSTPHGAGAAGATLLSPTWWSADELAAYLESVFPKLQADEEATEEIKSFGGEKLRKAERKTSGLEKQVDNLKETLSEKTLALEMRERELNQAQNQANELAQLQSENLLLRQQLEDMKNKTAQEQMRTVAQLQGELADAFRKLLTAEGSLKACTRQRDYLKQENSVLQEDLDKAKAKLCELSAQLELESEISLQLKARNQELRELAALLPHRLATPEEGHATTALYGEEWEQRAPEADGEMHGLTPRLQTQAAAQARREEIKTTDTSWKEPLMQTIRVLKRDLERAWSMQEETARQLAEIKSSK
ncbi:ankyrin repeat domain-containing protein 26-like [Grus japonensis]|uniref:Ankyrin repeat domain-containing protein 26-like n=1 Tax=Grus japonensis TaxID=30415 RepID=A0ABC9XMM7_GRUJA